ncbi:hypothetical protein LOK82_13145 [Xylella fastidiosa subsp. multiplex]|uniref:Uncharacterized protein n=1 Tax=Xylella fastidiosa subsp. multiplex TaxID=644357 RepID=A0AAW6I0Y7_XYLFS|nr:hypothetical protein [Xylella fastidiosa subsp. multiplex]
MMIRAHDQKALNEHISDTGALCRTAHEVDAEDAGIAVPSGRNYQVILNTVR